MSKAVVSVPGYLCVWEGALFCQIHLGLTGCFTLVFSRWIQLQRVTWTCFLWMPSFISLLTLRTVNISHALGKGQPGPKAGF